MSPTHSPATPRSDHEMQSCGDELLWLISPDGGKAASGAGCLTRDARLEEGAVPEPNQSLRQMQ
jgi:hypothetical protein